MDHVRGRSQRSPIHHLDEGTSARKRIAQACNGCRSKRVKCDGNTPQCNECRRRGEVCRYTTGENKRKRPSNAYIVALEARVAGLEKLLALRGGDAQSSAVSKDSQNGARDGVNELKPWRMRYPGFSDHEETDVDEITDALGCFTLGACGELRFFGGASNYSIGRDHFIRVCSSKDARDNGILAAYEMPSFSEPSEELRDHVLELYWKWQNSWQYLVARESFVTDLYVTHSQRYCTPLLLYAMLALGSRFSDRKELRTNPEDANTAGERFAQQARTMLHYEYDAPTTSTVQATTILALYWASMDREGLGFMYIGMASSMSMNLGLHLDCSNYARRHPIPEDDLEARNIAFWGVYTIDKLCSLGMGRPAGIHDSNITTKPPASRSVSIEGLTSEQFRISHPWPTSLINENAMQMCRLMQITFTTIDKLYVQTPKWTDQQKEDEIMHTHLKVVTWFEKLPKSLKISDSSLQPSPPFVYQLHLQYHVSMIFIHRAFFKVLFRGRAHSEYDPQGGDVHSHSCQHAAAKISNIFRIFQENYGNANMPISAVHPAFTAAIMHLLDLRTADPDGQRTAGRNLAICLKALYEMNATWNWSNRAIRAVQSLAKQWKVDAWLVGILNKIPLESRLVYENYERQGSMTTAAPGLSFTFDMSQCSPAGPSGDIWDAFEGTGEPGPFLDIMNDYSRTAIGQTGIGGD